MNDLDFVLTDKFFEYSEKMKTIHEELKVHEAELKAFYQEHKDKTSGLKQEAADLQVEWVQYKEDGGLSEASA